MNAIILAGGKSSRYGKNKALLCFEGETMIKRIVSVLQSVFNRVLLVTNQSDDYSFIENVVCLQDIIPGKGPLGGLFTGLTHSNTEYNYLTACDMPFLNQYYLQFLTSRQANYDILVPEYHGYLEPLAGIYSKKCLPVIKDSLNEDNLKIKSIYSEMDVRIIKEEELKKVGDPERFFFNINFKDDLASARKYLEAR